MEVDTTQRKKREYLNFEDIVKNSITRGGYNCIDGIDYNREMKFESDLE